jgi:tRNA(adenine34) deaminase
MWDSLSTIWKECIREAWGAYCAGSVPIGAVIVDQNNVIVARGRNQSYLSERSTSPLFGNPLAHAEINALVSLDYSTHNPRQCTLFVTTEPCPLCMGAIYMTGIAGFHYASIEPNAGSTNIIGKTKFLSKKKPQVVGPKDKKLELALFGMLTDFYFGLNHEKSNAYIIEWTKSIPEFVSFGKEIFYQGVLRDAKNSGDDAESVVSKLFDLIDQY